MNASDFPRLRLKPKADARAVRHGAPWVYSDDMVWDRRSKAVAPGSIAVLEDSAREPLALAAVHPDARVACRILTRDVEARIDAAWFAERFSDAVTLRDRLFDAPYYRLVHAEGDGLPGLIVDRFGDTLVVQPNAAWLETRLDDLVSALVDATGAKHILKNAASRARALEGLDFESKVLLGTPPDRVNVPMNGATYVADLAEGQKTGLFYDQRPNHAFAASLAQETEVLDVFSHVGGFALACLAGGARSALAVDGSAQALALANDGARETGVSERFQTLQSDAFDALASLHDQGRQFDIVICDPPAFAPSKAALTPGLRAYERIARLATPLVRRNGVLILCSCSHAATPEKFRNASLRGIGRAGGTPALLRTGFAGPDHPVHPALSATGYLKTLAFRIL